MADKAGGAHESNERDGDGGPIRKVSDRESACLLAFGVAALLAALALVGQAIARMTGTDIHQAAASAVCSGSPGSVSSAASE